MAQTQNTTNKYTGYINPEQTKLTERHDIIIKAMVVSHTSRLGRGRGSCGAHNTATRNR